MSTGGKGADTSPHRKRARHEATYENPQTSAQSTEGFSQLGGTNILHEPHRTVIRDNRKYLVENIDLVGTSVLDHLVQLQVLGLHQLEAIRDRYTTNLQLVGALLNHLCRRPHSDYEKFLTSLKDSNQGHVVVYLQDSHLGGDSEPCANISGLQRLMAKRIMSQYDKIKMWRWHDDHTAVSMEEQYVELVLVKYKESTLTREELPLSDYQHVLKQGTIYLMGEPGVGKSTFSMRISVDWAKAHCQGVEEKPLDGFKIEDFKFVLPIFLRSVKPGQTLREVIKDAYRMEWEEADGLCNYIKRHQETVLFILDGLDEYNLKTSQQFTDILHKRSLPHLNLFITSRYPSSCVYTEDEKPDIELSLRGFAKNGVTEYVVRFYQSKQEDGEALLTKIGESEELEHLSRYPSVLHMMATLWRLLPEFASTITGFYLDYIRYMLCTFQQKYSIPSTSYEEILAAYHKNLMRIGELATTAMMNDRVKLSFPFNDVIKHVGEETWKLGILIEAASFFGGRIVEFPHKTLHEFFVSFYIVNSPKSRQRELLMSLCGSQKAFAGSVMIRRFAMGLGGEELYKQMATLINGEEEDVAKMYTELQLDYLAEHRDARLMLPRVVLLYPTDRYPASHFVRYLSQNGRNMRKMWLSGNQRFWRLLQHLHAPQLAYLELNGVSWPTCSVDKQYITRTLYRTLAKFPLRQLTLCGMFVRFHDDDVSTVVRAVIHTKTLQELTFDWTRLTGDRIQTLTKWLPQSHLTSLTICHCNLSSRSMMAVLRVLPPSLLKLDVTGNHLRRLTNTRQLPGITRSQIQTLNMSTCRLSSLGMLVVIGALPETLTDLDLRANSREGDDDLVRMTEGTTQLNKLKTLNLQRLSMNNCHIKLRGVLAVIDAVPESLTDLDLGGNCREEEGDDLLSVTNRTTGLDKLKTLKLQRLNMSYCHFTSLGVLAVIDAAPEMLTDLDLSGNCWEEESDDRVSVTERTLQLNKLNTLRLQRLNMSNCHLTSRGVLAVIDAAPETLTDLDVSYNCQLGEGDDLMKVTERTAQLNRLRTLDLEDNMSRDVERTIKQKLTETCPHLKLGTDDPELLFESDSDESVEMETD